MTTSGAPAAEAARLLMPDYLVDAVASPALGYRDGPSQCPLDAVEFYVPPYLGSPDALTVLDHMPRLRVVQLLTAGFEDALAAVPAGVRLCNAAGVHDASTAELAVGLMIASLRGIDAFARAMPTGRWLPDRHRALADSSVLVIGAGGVGRAIAARTGAFEARVTLVGRTARPGVRGVDELPRLLGAADVVVLAVPLDDSTRGMVDAAFLRRLPDAALVVNVARGAVVDTEALLAETASGRLCAALDVTDPEPLPPEHGLWQVPNVLITPHVGGNSSAFLPRARALVAQQVRRFVTGEEPANTVGWGR